MTSRYERTIGGGRTRPPRASRPRVLAACALALALLLPGGREASAHAEPERANPPVSGTVPVVPAVVEIWFDEEVVAEGTTIRVIGPGGAEASTGPAELDLFDPNRQHVTVPLSSVLGPGTYTVQWVSLSATDGDEARGGYVFTVGSASPVAVPAASPAATPAPAGVAPQHTPTPTPTPAVQIGNDELDTRALGISVLVGIVAAAGIFVFWRLVRPKNPRFGG